MKLIERSQSVFKWLASTPARLPSRLEIPNERIDNPDKLGPTLAKDKCYFQVRVNEMFLANKRQWFKTFYPMVYVGTEFQYDREEVAIPFVLGPNTIKSAIDPSTKNVVFKNTRVAGVSPYRGGRLTVTLILYRVTENNYARGLLNMVENLAGSLDFATSLSVYTKIAGAVLDGMETLSASEDSQPILGHRMEFDPDAGDTLKPGYFVFVDMDRAELDRYELWVKDDSLMHGPSLETAQPFRDADYVLTSLTARPERSDVNMLPFAEVWDRVIKEAAIPRVKNFKSAKANMASLYQTMLLSPDLIEDHAMNLSTGYMERMVKVHEHARAISNLDDAEAEADQMDKLRDASLKILDL
ncbi:MAG: hypothetical protein RDA78_20540 [Roseibium sp.]|uniref:hypothetical protein n=1 Tax=Roseibium sp. TaxID=1936156 RepID=UPI003D9C0835